MISVDKYHGTGNDFVVVDAAADVPDRRAFARALCDRETGIEGPDGDRIGADGVLFLDVDADESPPRAEMTLVQPDGSTAAMCGNGARCAATWVGRRAGGGEDGGGATGEVVLDTPAGTRHATIHADGNVTVEMGRPSFDPADVPLSADLTEPLVEEAVEGLTVTAVNTGVPHAVAVVEDVDAVDLAAVAPAVRHADVFPEGANVTLAERVDGSDGDADGPPAYRQRTFERGVEGETRSCGTGAVAVAAVARRLGAVADGEPVRVTPPGGTLTVTVEEGAEATLRGPVSFEFSTEVDERAGRERASAGAGGPAEPGE